MRLSSIWTMRGFPLKERLVRTKNWIAQKVAASLPKSVRYWVLIQMVAKATMKVNPMEASLDYILKNVDTPKNLR